MILEIYTENKSHLIPLSPFFSSSSHNIPPVCFSILIGSEGNSVGQNIFKNKYKTFSNVKEILCFFISQEKNIHHLTFIFKKGNSKQRAECCELFPNFALLVKGFSKSSSLNGFIENLKLTLTDKYFDSHSLLKNTDHNKLEERFTASLKLKLKLKIEKHTKSPQNTSA